MRIVVLGYATSRKWLCDYSFWVRRVVAWPIASSRIKPLNKHYVALYYYKKNKIGENLSFLC